MSRWNGAALASLKRLLKLVDALIDDAAADHYGVYRTHLDFMNKVANSYSWNDGAPER